MDEVDRANDVAAEMLRRNIASAASSANEVEASGICLFCDEPVEHPARWCNADCRDLWEKRRSLYRGAYRR